VTEIFRLLTSRIHEDTIIDRVCNSTHLTPHVRGPSEVVSASSHSLLIFSPIVELDQAELLALQEFVIARSGYFLEPIKPVK
jgi:hypothetical protein